MKRFGEKLHILRKKHHLALQALATELDYGAHSHISQLESGKKQPTVEFVLKVADRFEISVDQLLRDELKLVPQLDEIVEQFCKLLLARWNLALHL